MEHTIRWENKNFDDMGTLMYFSGKEKQDSGRNVRDAGFTGSPNSSLHAGSTCVHLQLLASLFGQGLTFCVSCQGCFHEYNLLG